MLITLPPHSFLSFYNLSFKVTQFSAMNQSFIQLGFSGYRASEANFYVIFPSIAHFTLNWFSYTSGVGRWSFSLHHRFSLLHYNFYDLVLKWKNRTAISESGIHLILQFFERAKRASNFAYISVWITLVYCFIHCLKVV